MFGSVGDDVGIARSFRPGAADGAATVQAIRGYALTIFIAHCVYTSTHGQQIAGPKTTPGNPPVCRNSLGLEPMTVMHAYRLWQDDPAAEVLTSYPDANLDERMAAHWEGNWAREWERRFAGR